jgi:5S rRNA maturation endonuclease (ribonuclease M5)
MTDIHSKVLLVEGKQDARVIPELIEANGVNWGTKKSPIVHIREGSKSTKGARTYPLAFNDDSSYSVP